MAPMTTLAPSQSVTARDPKGTKFISIVEAAYNKAKLSEEEAQRVNDTPGLADLIADFIARSRLPNDFAKEEVPSTYRYRSGYKKPKPIAEQIAILRTLFPQLGSCNEPLASGSVPEGAGGDLAIPP